jgi:hypothetical protein
MKKVKFAHFQCQLIAKSQIFFLYYVESSKLLMPAQLIIANGQFTDPMDAYPSPPNMSIRLVSGAFKGAIMTD